MLQERNHLGQAVGEALPDWQPPFFPPYETMEGQYCRLEPLQPGQHVQDLYEANCLDAEGKNWTWLPYGPFASREDYRVWLEAMALARDPQFYTIIDKALGQAVGVAAYMRIDPQNGSIEVGHLNFSPLLQKKPAATEAMYLMMAHAFRVGYRRYEWKCNALNTPSWKAAERLGFSFEGVFRQAAVIKGRNRNTAWFSIIDSEWPMLQGAFERWLSPSNFDLNGRQKTSLSVLTQKQ